MHCDKCNTQVSPEDRFCKNCFNTLHREETFAFNMSSVLRENPIIARDSQVSEETSEKHGLATKESAVLEESIVKSEMATEEPQVLEESLVKSEMAIEKPQVLEKPVVKSEVAIEKPQGKNVPVTIDKPQGLEEPVVPSKVTQETTQMLEETPLTKGNVLSSVEENLGLRNMNRRIFVTHPALLNYKHFIIAITFLIISLIGLARTPSLILFFITVVPYGIFLYAILHAKSKFEEQGYVDFPIDLEGTGKIRYFTDGRKERHVKGITQAWLITDITDQHVVNEINAGSRRI